MTLIVLKSDQSVRLSTRLQRLTPQNSKPSPKPFVNFQFSKAQIPSNTLLFIKLASFWHYKIFIQKNYSVIFH